MSEFEQRDLDAYHAKVREAIDATVALQAAADLAAKNVARTAMEVTPERQGEEFRPHDLENAPTTCTGSTVGITEHWEHRGQYAAALRLGDHVVTLYSPEALETLAGHALACAAKMRAAGLRLEG